MANPEHLAKLKEGVTAWNNWRIKNEAIEPDLFRADLTRANLIGANLTRASLTRANLTRAHLTHASLRRADLTGADLKEAELTHVNLNFAVLQQADFSHAELGGTIFADVNLSGAKGLDNVRHLWPSTVGIDTIYLSNGEIPEAFLRGCGVPDAFITFAKSLVTSPFQFYSCFISYSTKDQAFADRLYADLQNKGV